MSKHRISFQSNIEEQIVAMDLDDGDGLDYALFEDGGGGWIFKPMVGEKRKHLQCLRS
jgi:hypothetical protein